MRHFWKYGSVILLTAVLLLGALQVFAGDVSLAWDPSTSEGVVGYKVHHGSAPGAYSSFHTVTNQTAFTVTGLAAGTYYFAVTAFDANGNESGYSNEVSTVVADNTPPQTTGTDPVSVEPLPVDPIPVDPLPADPLPVDPPDTTVKTADGTPPVLSGIAVSGQTGTAVTISWTTNEASDSQIEYGTTTGYGSSTAIDPSTVFSHTQVLTGLTPATTYHFKVLSSDAADNLAASEDYAFTTMKVAATETMPIAFSKMIASDELFAGVAVVNDTASQQTIALTAFDGSGNMILGDGITNPVVLQMRGNQQLSLVDVEIFGNNLSRYCSSGWIRMDSTTEDIRGFSFTLDGLMNLVDAVAFSSTPATDFVFTHVESGGSTALSIINRNVQAVGVRIDLVQADGSLRGSVSRVINGNAALTEDLFSQLFSGWNPNSSDYVRVSANRDVEAFQVIQQGSADIAFLNGRARSEASSVLYLPRYVYSSKAYRTDISIVNMSPEPGYLSIRLIGDSGVQIGTTRNVEIAGNGKLFIDGPEFFTDQVLIEEPTSGVIKGKSVSAKFNGKSTGHNVGSIPSDISGYVEIVGQGIGLVGSTSYRGRNSQSFISTFPLVSRLQNEVVSSHVVSDDLFWSEMALANPGTADALVYLGLFNGRGDSVDAAKISLPAGRKIDFSLKEVFKSLQSNNQNGGYVFMSSDAPIAAFSLFGKTDQSVFSAIPLQ
jgi:hypothetical protein